MIWNVWSSCVLFTNKDGLITARTCTINYPIGTCILYNHAFLRFRTKMKDFWYFLPYNFQIRDYSLELMMFTHAVTSASSCWHYDFHSMVVDAKIIWISSLWVDSTATALVMNVSPLCFNWFLNLKWSCYIY